MEHLDNERIQNYLDGALEEKERVRAEEHLAQCSSCAQEMRAWEEVFGTLGELPYLEPSKGFEARVLEGLGFETWWRRLFARPPRPLWPKAALAGAMATVAGWLFFLSLHLPNLLAPQNATLLTLPAKVSHGASGAFFALTHALGELPSFIRDIGFYLKIGNAMWAGVDQPAVWGALFLVMTFSLYVFRAASSHSLGITRRNYHGSLTANLF